MVLSHDIPNTDISSHFLYRTLTCPINAVKKILEDGTIDTKNLFLNLFDATNQKKLKYAQE